VVTFARKVASLGRFEDPGPALTKEVEAARTGIAAAAAAADANSFVKAAEAYADAEAAAARAAGMAQVYVTGMIEGAGGSVTVLEGTRDLAFIAETVLATVATAGVPSGAIAASTTAFGAEIGTAGAASVIATATPIAGSVATAATKVALGDKIDWGAVAIDASLQLFISRFGGPATKGIAAAVTKRLAGKLAAESIARMGIEKMVHGLVLQEGSAALGTVAESTYAALRGKDITWEQFFKALLTRLTDPKGIAVAVVVTAISSGAEMKYGGAHAATGATGGGEPPSSDKLFPELTEKEVGTAVDDATSGTPLREEVYRDAPEVDDATDNANAGGAESPSSDKLLPELTDEEVGSAVDNTRAGTMIEVPGHNPHTGEGLVGVEIRADETAGIAHHENMTFEGIAGVSVGDQLQVRRHSANAGAPAGSHSRDNPTTQINTVDPARPRQSKEFRLPGRNPQALRGHDRSGKGGCPPGLRLHGRRPSVSTRKFWTFFGGIFFGAGLIVLLVGVHATYRAYGDVERLAQEGQVAEGIVLERRIETRQNNAAGRANAGSTEGYTLVYRFTTADGQAIPTKPASTVPPGIVSSSARRSASSMFPARRASTRSPARSRNGSGCSSRPRLD
jgi:hypothetical protein